MSRTIAGHVLDFLDHEVRRGRLPRSLLPIQSGVGYVANAVLAGLEERPRDGLTAYTEVPQAGWPRILLLQPAAWTVPLPFATMVVVSRLGRPPAGAERLMLAMHLPGPQEPRTHGPS